MVTARSRVFTRSKTDSIRIIIEHGVDVLKEDVTDEPISVFEGFLWNDRGETIGAGAGADIVLWRDRVCHSGKGQLDYCG